MYNQSAGLNVKREMQRYDLHLICKIFLITFAWDGISKYFFSCDILHQIDPIISCPDFRKM